jgi:translocation and assembly module TamB
MIRTIAKWLGFALIGLVLLVGATFLFIDTQIGRRFVADRLAGYTTASGINIRAGRIDGSLFSRMHLHHVEIRDTQGVFLTIPDLDIDWRPFAYLHSKIDVRDVVAPTMVMLRKPALKPVPSDPDAPILPDIDLDIGHLRIDRFDFRPAVTGRRHVVSVTGRASIADGRAQINADAAALQGPKVAGGDRLHLLLDAVPAQNRLQLDARLTAPKGGLVDSYAGLGKPLALTVNGRGAWSDWRGAAIGQLGTEPLARIDLTARNGTFHAKGLVRPGLILTGPAARLTDPAVALDLITTLADRTADTRLTARSDAFALDAAGLLDLGNSRFRNVRIAAHLLRPAVLAPNVSGRDVALAATLDGAFVTPTLDYRLTAAGLAFDTTGISGLQAHGKAVVDVDRVSVPIHATARAVTGLNAAAGGLLTNLRVDGDLVYQNGKVATDNLQLRSDRIDATAILLADLAKGTYTGALKGRVNDYEIAGLGRVNLLTDARVVPGQGGGFAIRGHVKLVTRHLTNAAVAGQLGGNAVIDADVGYDLAGGASLTNLRLRAPKFRINQGSGFYRLDGKIGFRAAGASSAYGPLLVDVTGTVARPNVRLRAASPGVGIGLANVDATLAATAAGYRVRAKGSSAYGPLDVDVTIRTGNTARFDIASATVAGLRLSGGVAATPTGPFAGTLTLTGQGLTGTVRLAAQGALQRADVDLRASAARLPGPAPVTIGNGTLHAVVLMTPGTPSVTGQFAFGDLRYGSVALARVQGTIEERDGRGRVRLVARGNQAGAPFDLAAQAELDPARILVNLRGTANGIAFRLAAPALVRKVGADWQLQPTTIILPQGQVDLSGQYGARTQLRALLRNLDLSVVDAFIPSLGLGGKASGMIDYAAVGTVPDLRARIDIAGFTRTAALTVSDPLDIALLATLGANGADARALIRNGPTIVGRMQARLAPLGAGAALSQRIMAAPLSGGIRYNGPAELLWALTGIARQDLSGPVAIGADFGGRLESPTLTGLIRANALRYVNETYGTVLSNMAVEGRFTQSRLDLTKLSANAGNGTIAAAGSVGFDATGGFPIDVTVTLQNARLARGDDIDATVTGNIHLTNSKAAGGLIQGNLVVPQARYEIVRQGASSVPALTGIRRKGAPPVTPSDASPLPSNWKLSLDLRADNRIFVSGMGLEAEWRTRMHVGGTSATPNVTGTLEVVRGTYSFAGRRFDIDHGTVTFQGGLTNPALDIAANTTVEDVTATIAIGGYAQAPQISFTSTPSLPQDEVLSRILFGSSVTSLSPIQAIQLAAALNSLRGSGGGLNPLGKLRGIAGVDRLRVLGADETAGRGTALAAGKYISNNIYVEIITDARGFTATQLEVSLSRALSILSQSGSFGGSNVSLRYKKTF